MLLSTIFNDIQDRDLQFKQRQTPMYPAAQV